MDDIRFNVTSYLLQSPQVKVTRLNTATRLIIKAKSLVQQCIHRYTHISRALPEGSLGGLPSLSLTTKGSWIHLWGEVRQASHQLSDASTPLSMLSLATLDECDKCNLSQLTLAFNNEFVHVVT